MSVPKELLQKILDGTKKYANAISNLPSTDLIDSLNELNSFLKLPEKTGASPIALLTQSLNIIENHKKIWGQQVQSSVAIPFEQFVSSYNESKGTDQTIFEVLDFMFTMMYTTVCFFQQGFHMIEDLEPQLHSNIIKLTNLKNSSSSSSVSTSNSIQKVKSNEIQTNETENENEKEKEKEEETQPSFVQNFQNTNIQSKDYFQGYLQVSRGIDGKPKKKFCIFFDAIISFYKSDENLTKPKRVDLSLCKVTCPDSPLPISSTSSSSSSLSSSSSSSSSSFDESEEDSSRNQKSQNQNQNQNSNNLCVSIIDQAGNVVTLRSSKNEEIKSIEKSTGGDDSEMKESKDSENNNNEESNILPWITMFKDKGLLSEYSKTNIGHNSSSNSNNHRPPISSSQLNIHSAIVTSMRSHHPSNNYCADCGAEGPTWVSRNIGVLICEGCASIHCLIPLLSSVRSFELNQCTYWDLLIARSLNNQLHNEIWEATLSENSSSSAESGGGPLSISLSQVIASKPLPDSSKEQRENFILAKYEEKRWILPIQQTDSLQQIQSQLEQAIEQEDKYKTIELLRRGVDMNAISQSDEKSIWHRIIEKGDISVDFLHILLEIQEPKVDVKDGSGNSVIDLVVKHDRIQYAHILFERYWKVPQFDKDALITIANENQASNFLEAISSGTLVLAESSSEEQRLKKLRESVLESLYLVRAEILTQRFHLQEAIQMKSHERILEVAKRVRVTKRTLLFGM